MISIALCTYNGSRFIREQLDSLMKQTLRPNEIVISDDNSKDDTLAIVEEFQKNNPDISFVINKNVPGLGVFKNFEKAISLCTGDIIFCCDQDDYWKPKKIEKTYKAFGEDTTLVFANAAVTGIDVKDYIGPLWSQKQIEERLNSPYRTFVYQGGSVAGCCLAFRRSLLERIMPFPDKIYHDDWLVTCAAVMGKVACVNEELMCYRQHGNNTVGITRGSELSYYKSLITNPKPYREHRTYIYGRNQLMFAALKEKDLAEDLTGLNECLEFYGYRADLNKASLAVLRSCLRKTWYEKYANGFRDYVYDVYLSLK